MGVLVGGGVPRGVLVAVAVRAGVLVAAAAPTGVVSVLDITGEKLAP